MTKLVTKEQLLSALAELGDSPEGIALSLWSSRICGDRKSYDSCPIARFLRSKGFKLVEAGRITVFANDRRVPTPEPVREFIQAFDNGMWSRLVAAEVQ